MFTLEPQNPDAVKADAAERMYVMRPVGKQAIPDLQAGPARIVVRAARPVLYGIRQAESTATRDVQVRLEPPRVAVLSTFHYVNLGGSEFVVYRATPDDVESGVRVGDQRIPGLPREAAPASRGDPALRVAFFALLFDQDPNAPMQVFARDAAGNEAVVPLDHQVFPKPYGKSRIELDDRFLQRVVPAIAGNSPDEKIPTDDVLARLPEDQRRPAAEEQSVPDGAREEDLAGDAVQGRLPAARQLAGRGEVRRHPHLHLQGQGRRQAGPPRLRPRHDGQRRRSSPRSAGRIVHASDLGIYGNCVVIDHGLGVQSLYGHLSSIGVKVGDMVEKGQEIGRSGMTGLAGGDHLHFTMLVGGQQVTPVDWWSAQWMQDRVLRKIMAAGGV